MNADSGAADISDLDRPCHASGLMSADPVGRTRMSTIMFAARISSNAGALGTAVDR